MKIDNVTAVVTGGASGLGAATATMLAARGAKVVIFDLNDDLGEKTAAEIGGSYYNIDVTDEEAVVHVMSDVTAKYGPVRILVNCAGISPPAKTVDRHGAPMALSMFRKVVEINLIGTFNVASKFAAALSGSDMIGEERGVIVNTASVAAFEGQVGQTAYAASKAGIAGMTLPMARDLAQYGIRVVTIAPGLFLTPMMKTLPEEAQRSLGAQVPFPSRLGDPSEYAALAEAIITNPMLNGETIRIDGAIRMAPR